MNIYDEYDKLLKYCYMKTHDSFLAEDLVQEAFVKYFSNPPKSESVAYLYTIARNLCIDNYRKLNFDFEESVHVTVNDNHDNLEIEEALNKLPELDREIIVMRFIDDMKIKDIANIFNVSRFVIQRKIKNALNILKMELGGADE